MFVFMIINQVNDIITFIFFRLCVLRRFVTLSVIISITRGRYLIDLYLKVLFKNASYIGIKDATAYVVTIITTIYFRTFVHNQFVVYSISGMKSCCETKTKPRFTMFGYVSYGLDHCLDSFYCA